MIQRQRPDQPKGFIAFVFAMMVLGCFVSQARARAASADVALHKIIPANAGLTITVTDLRGHAAELLESKLARAFFALPAVKEWFAGERGQALTKARAEIETHLGVSLKTIRDELLGDAVVLSLHFDPEKGMQTARGLALTHARDLPLLEKLLALLNKSDATLDRVEEVGANDLAYKVRRFKAESGREPEYYRVFADGTFAWSNSQDLIKAVVDLKANGDKTGLGGDSSFQAVRGGLPARSFVSMIFSPALTKHLLSLCTQPGDVNQARVARLIAGYLPAIRGVGLAIEFRDGIVLHAHEVIDPQKLDADMVRWAKSSNAPESLVKRIPGTAIGVAAMAIDAGLILQALKSLSNEADQPRIEGVLTVFQGILLGRDVPTQVLPWLGPGLMAYVEEPGSGWPRFPVVGVLQFRDDHNEPGLAKAIDNAIRTVTAVYSLDVKRSAARFRLISSRQGKVQVTSFAESSIPFAYSVGRDCLVIGTSVDAVARFGNDADPADSRLAPFRSSHFAEAQSFAAIDLTRLVRIATEHRTQLIKRFGKPNDLDHALALLDLFQGAFFAVRVDPELKSAHQSVGLVAK